MNAIISVLCMENYAMHSNLMLEKILLILVPVHFSNLFVRITPLIRMLMFTLHHP